MAADLYNSLLTVPGSSDKKKRAVNRCPECPYTHARYTPLINHCKMQHGDKYRQLNEVFDTKAKFESWLTEYCEQNHSQYKVQNTRKTNCNVETIYQCHRSDYAEIKEGMCDAISHCIFYNFIDTVVICFF
jgi:hypothetical protein